MNTKQLLINEFEQRVFTESYQRIYKCLSLLQEKDIWASPNSNIPAIGNLILHLSGNARQWILSGIGGKPDNRLREEEFIVQTNVRKSELIFLMEHLKVNIRHTLNTIESQDLNKKRSIQGFDVTCFSAIIHVLEHFSYHTGQITTLTKWIVNKDTGFYGGLDLDQRNSPN